MKYKDSKDFFDKCGKHFIKTELGDIQIVSVEDMYQHFKARMIDELRVNSSELLYFAKLVEINKD